MNRRTPLIAILAGSFLAAVGTTACLAADDEAAIRQTVQSYVAAFNGGDATTLAKFWAEDGQFVTPAGDVLQGREAIQEAFEAFFKEDPGVEVKVKIASIKMGEDGTAVEEGAAQVTRSDQEPTVTTYVARYVQQDGKWMLKSIREAFVPPSHYDKLQELEWLIGEWVDQDENSTINTTCEWTKNQNFISRSFSVSIRGQIELEGTQMIGWDPAGEQIRSWMFDSDGCVGEGVWKRKGNRWIVRTSQVLAGGEKASSVNIITRLDNNKFTWQSISREVDGELLPNLGEVTVVRRQSRE